MLANHGMCNTTDDKCRNCNANRRLRASNQKTEHGPAHMSMAGINYMLQKDWEKTPENASRLAGHVYRYIVHRLNLLKRLRNGGGVMPERFLELVHRKFLYVHFFYRDVAEKTGKYEIDNCLMQALVAYIMLEMHVSRTPEHNRSKEYRVSLIARLKTLLYDMYSAYYYHHKGRTNRFEIWELIWTFLQNEFHSDLPDVFDDLLDDIKSMLSPEVIQPSVPYCSGEVRKSDRSVDVQHHQRRSQINLFGGKEIETTPSKTKTSKSETRTTTQTDHQDEDVWVRFKHMQHITRTNLKVNTTIILSDSEDDELEIVEDTPKSGSLVEVYRPKNDVVDLTLDEEEETVGGGGTIISRQPVTRDMVQGWGDLLNEARSWFRKCQQLIGATGDAGVTIRNRNGNLEINTTGLNASEARVSQRTQKQLEWYRDYEEPFTNCPRPLIELPVEGVPKSEPDTCLSRDDISNSPLESRLEQATDTLRHLEQINDDADQNEVEQQKDRLDTDNTRHKSVIYNIVKPVDDKQSSADSPTYIDPSFEDQTTRSPQVSCLDNKPPSEERPHITAHKPHLPTNTKHDHTSLQDTSHPTTPPLQSSIEPTTSPLQSSLEDCEPSNTQSPEETTLMEPAKAAASSCDEETHQVSHQTKTIKITESLSQKDSSETGATLGRVESHGPIHEDYLLTELEEYVGTYEEKDEDTLLGDETEKSDKDQKHNIVSKEINSEQIEDVVPQTGPVDSAATKASLEEAASETVVNPVVFLKENPTSNKDLKYMSSNDTEHATKSVTETTSEKATSEPIVIEAPPLEATSTELTQTVAAESVVIEESLPESTQTKLEVATIDIEGPLKDDISKEPFLSEDYVIKELTELKPTVVEAHTDTVVTKATFEEDMPTLEEDTTVTKAPVEGGLTLSIQADSEEISAVEAHTKKVVKIATSDGGSTKTTLLEGDFTLSTQAEQEKNATVKEIYTETEATSEEAMTKTIVTEASLKIDIWLSKQTEQELTTESGVATAREYTEYDVTTISDSTLVPTLSVPTQAALEYVSNDLTLSKHEVTTESVAGEAFTELCVTENPLKEEYRPTEQSVAVGPVVTELSEHEVTTESVAGEAFTESCVTENPLKEECGPTKHSVAVEPVVTELSQNEVTTESVAEEAFTETCATENSLKEECRSIEHSVALDPVVTELSEHEVTTESVAEEAFTESCVTENHLKEKCRPTEHSDAVDLVVTELSEHEVTTESVFEEAFTESCVKENPLKEGFRPTEHSVAVEPVVTELSEHEVTTESVFEEAFTESCVKENPLKEGFRPTEHSVAVEPVVTELSEHEVTRESVVTEAFTKSCLTENPLKEEYHRKPNKLSVAVEPVVAEEASTGWLITDHILKEKYIPADSRVSVESIGSKVSTESVEIEQKECIQIIPEVSVKSVIIEHPLEDDSTECTPVEHEVIAESAVTENYLEGCTSVEEVIPNTDITDNSLEVLSTESAQTELLKTAEPVVTKASLESVSTEAEHQITAEAAVTKDLKETTQDGHVVIGKSVGSHFEKKIAESNIAEVPIDLSQTEHEVSVATEDPLVEVYEEPVETDVPLDSKEVVITETPSSSNIEYQCKEKDLTHIEEVFTDFVVTEPQAIESTEIEVPFENVNCKDVYAPNEIASSEAECIVEESLQVYPSELVETEVCFRDEQSNQLDHEPVTPIIKVFPTESIVIGAPLESVVEYRDDYTVYEASKTINTEVISEEAHAGYVATDAPPLEHYSNYNETTPIEQETADLLVPEVAATSFDRATVVQQGPFESVSQCNPSTSVIRILSDVTIRPPRWQPQQSCSYLPQQPEHAAPPANTDGQEKSSHFEWCAVEDEKPPMEDQVQSCYEDPLSVPTHLNTPSSVEPSSSDFIRQEDSFREEDPVALLTLERLRNLREDEVLVYQEGFVSYTQEQLRIIEEDKRRERNDPRDVLQAVRGHHHQETVVAENVLNLSHSGGGHAAYYGTTMHFEQPVDQSNVQDWRHQAACIEEVPPGPLNLSSAFSSVVAMETAIVAVKPMEPATVPNSYLQGELLLGSGPCDDNILREFSAVALERENYKGTSPSDVAATGPSDDVARAGGCESTDSSDSEVMLKIVEPCSSPEAVAVPKGNRNKAGKRRKSTLSSAATKRERPPTKAALKLMPVELRSNKANSDDEIPLAQRINIDTHVYSVSEQNISKVSKGPLNRTTRAPAKKGKLSQGRRTRSQSGSQCVDQPSATVEQQQVPTPPSAKKKTKKKPPSAGSPYTSKLRSRSQSTSDKDKTEAPPVVIKPKKEDKPKEDHLVSKTKHKKAKEEPSAKRKHEKPKEEPLLVKNTKPEEEPLVNKPKPHKPKEDPSLVNKAKPDKSKEEPLVTMIKPDQQPKEEPIPDKPLKVTPSQTPVATTSKRKPRNPRKNSKKQLSEKQEETTQPPVPIISNNSFHSLTETHVVQTAKGLLENAPTQCKITLATSPDLPLKKRFVYTEIITPKNQKYLNETLSKLGKRQCLNFDKVLQQEKCDDSTPTVSTQNVGPHKLHPAFLDTGASSMVASAPSSPLEKKHAFNLKADEVVDHETKNVDKEPLHKHPEININTTELVAEDSYVLPNSNDHFKSSVPISAEERVPFTTESGQMSDERIMTSDSQLCSSKTDQMEPLPKIPEDKPSTRALENREGNLLFLSQQILDFLIAERRAYYMTHSHQQINKGSDQPDTSTNAADALEVGSEVLAASEGPYSSLASEFWAPEHDNSETLAGPPDDISTKEEINNEVLVEKFIGNNKLQETPATGESELEPDVFKNTPKTSHLDLVMQSENSARIEIIVEEEISAADNARIHSNESVINEMCVKDNSARAPSNLVDTNQSNLDCVKESPANLYENISGESVVQQGLTDVIAEEDQEATDQPSEASAFKFESPGMGFGTASDKLNPVPHVELKEEEAPSTLDTGDVGQGHFDANTEIMAKTAPHANSIVDVSNSLLTSGTVEIYSSNLDAGEYPVTIDSQCTVDVPEVCIDETIHESSMEGTITELDEHADKSSVVELDLLAPCYYECEVEVQSDTKQCEFDDAYVKLCDTLGSSVIAEDVPISAAEENIEQKVSEPVFSAEQNVAADDSVLSESIAGNTSLIEDSESEIESKNKYVKKQKEKSSESVKKSSKERLLREKDQKQDKRKKKDSKTAQSDQNTSKEVPAKLESSVEIIIVKSSSKSSSKSNESKVQKSVIKQVEDPSKKESTKNFRKERAVKESKSGSHKEGSKPPSSKSDSERIKSCGESKKLEKSSDSRDKSSSMNSVEKKQHKTSSKERKSNDGGEHNMTTEKASGKKQKTELKQERHSSKESKKGAREHVRDAQASTKKEKVEVTNRHSPLETKKSTPENAPKKNADESHNKTNQLKDAKTVEDKTKTSSPSKNASPKHEKEHRHSHKKPAEERSAREKSVGGIDSKSSSGKSKSSRHSSEKSTNNHNHTSSSRSSDEESRRRERTVSRPRDKSIKVREQSSSSKIDEKAEKHKSLPEKLSNKSSGKVDKDKSQHKEDTVKPKYQPTNDLRSKKNTVDQSTKVKKDSSKTQHPESSSAVSKDILSAVADKSELCVKNTVKPKDQPTNDLVSKKNTVDQSTKVKKDSSKTQHPESSSAVSKDILSAVADKSELCVKDTVKPKDQPTNDLVSKKNTVDQSTKVKKDSSKTQHPESSSAVSKDILSAVADKSELCVKDTVKPKDQPTNDLVSKKNTVDQSTKVKKDSSKTQHPESSSAVSKDILSAVADKSELCVKDTVKPKDQPTNDLVSKKNTVDQSTKVKKDSSKTQHQSSRSGAAKEISAVADKSELSTKENNVETKSRDATANTEIKKRHRSISGETRKLYIRLEHHMGSINANEKVVFDVKEGSSNDITLLNVTTGSHNKDTVVFDKKKTRSIISRKSEECLVELHNIKRKFSETQEESQNSTADGDFTILKSNKHMDSSAAKRKCTENNKEFSTKDISKDSPLEPKKKSSKKKESSKKTLSKNTLVAEPPRLKDELCKNKDISSCDIVDLPSKKTKGSIIDPEPVQESKIILKSLSCNVEVPMSLDTYTEPLPNQTKLEENNDNSASINSVFETVVVKNPENTHSTMDTLPKDILMEPSIRDTKLAENKDSSTALFDPKMVQIPINLLSLDHLSKDNADSKLLKNQENLVKDIEGIPHQISKISIFDPDVVWEPKNADSFAEVTVESRSKDNLIEASLESKTLENSEVNSATDIISPQSPKPKESFFDPGLVREPENTESSDNVMIDNDAPLETSLRDDKLETNKDNSATVVLGIPSLKTKDCIFDPDVTKEPEIIPVKDNLIETSLKYKVLDDNIKDNSLTAIIDPQSPKSKSSIFEPGVVQEPEKTESSVKAVMHSISNDCPIGEYVIDNEFEKNKDNSVTDALGITSQQSKGSIFDSEVTKEPEIVSSKDNLIETCLIDNDTYNSTTDIIDADIVQAPEKTDSSVKIITIHPISTDIPLETSLKDNEFEKNKDIPATDIIETPYLKPKRSIFDPDFVRELVTLISYENTTKSSAKITIDPISNDTPIETSLKYNALEKNKDIPATDIIETPYLKSKRSIFDPDFVRASVSTTEASAKITMHPISNDTAIETSLKDNEFEKNKDTPASDIIETPFIKSKRSIFDPDVVREPVSTTVSSANDTVKVHSKRCLLEPNILKQKSSKVKGLPIEDMVVPISGEELIDQQSTKIKNEEVLIRPKYEGSIFDPDVALESKYLGSSAKNNIDCISKINQKPSVRDPVGLQSLEIKGSIVESLVLLPPKVLEAKKGTKESLTTSVSMNSIFDPESASKPTQDLATPLKDCLPKSKAAKIKFIKVRVPATKKKPVVPFSEEPKPIANTVGDEVFISRLKLADFRAANKESPSKNVILKAPIPSDIVEEKRMQPIPSGQIDSSTKAAGSVEFIAKTGADPKSTNQERKTSKVKSFSSSRLVYPKLERSTEHLSATNHSKKHKPSSIEDIINSLGLNDPSTELDVEQPQCFENIEPPTIINPTTFKSMPLETASETHEIAENSQAPIQNNIEQNPGLQGTLNPTTTTHCLSTGKRQRPLNLESDEYPADKRMCISMPVCADVSVSQFETVFHKEYPPHNLGMEAPKETRFENAFTEENPLQQLAHPLENISETDFNKSLLQQRTAPLVDNANNTFETAFTPGGANNLETATIPVSGQFTFGQMGASQSNSPTGTQNSALSLTNSNSVSSQSVPDSEHFEFLEFDIDNVVVIDTFQTPQYNAQYSGECINVSSELDAATSHHNAPYQPAPNTFPPCEGSDHSYADPLAKNGVDAVEQFHKSLQGSPIGGAAACKDPPATPTPMTKILQQPDLVEAALRYTSITTPYHQSIPVNSGRVFSSDSFPAFNGAGNIRGCQDHSYADRVGTDGVETVKQFQKSAPYTQFTGMSDATKPGFMSKPLEVSQTAQFNPLYQDGSADYITVSPALGRISQATPYETLAVEGSQNLPQGSISQVSASNVPDISSTMDSWIGGDTMEPENELGGILPGDTSWDMSVHLPDSVVVDEANLQDLLSWENNSSKRETNDYTDIKSLDNIIDDGTVEYSEPELAFEMPSEVGPQSQPVESGEKSVAAEAVEVPPIKVEVPERPLNLAEVGPQSQPVESGEESVVAEAVEVPPIKVEAPKRPMKLAAAKVLQAPKQQPKLATVKRLQRSQMKAPPRKTELHVAKVRIKPMHDLLTPSPKGIISNGTLVADNTNAADTKKPPTGVATAPLLENPPSPQATEEEQLHAGNDLSSLLASAASNKPSTNVPPLKYLGSPPVIMGTRNATKQLKTALELSQTETKTKPSSVDPFDLIKSVPTNPYFNAQIASKAGGSKKRKDGKQQGTADDNGDDVQCPAAGSSPKSRRLNNSKSKSEPYKSGEAEGSYEPPVSDTSEPPQGFPPAASDQKSASDSTKPPTKGKTDPHTPLHEGATHKNRAKAGSDDKIEDDQYGWLSTFEMNLAEKFNRTLQRGNCNT